MDAIICFIVGDDIGRIGAIYIHRVSVAMWLAEYPILAFHNNIVLCSRRSINLSLSSSGCSDRY